jgi:hypothetical protein
MPAIAPNTPEPSCIVAIIHPTNVPLRTRAKSPHTLRSRRSIRQQVHDVLTDGGDRQDDTPDAASHEQHCSHRRKGTKPRDKAEAQGKIFHPSGVILVQVEATSPRNLRSVRAVIVERSFPTVLSLITRVGLCVTLAGCALETERQSLGYGDYVALSCDRPG